MLGESSGNKKLYRNPSLWTVAIILPAALFKKGLCPLNPKYLKT